MLICPQCKDTGLDPENPTLTCPTCLGKGMVNQIGHPCAKCKGKKVLYGNTCDTCRGTGVETTLVPFGTPSRTYQVDDLRPLLQRLYETQLGVPFDRSQPVDAHQLAVVMALLEQSGTLVRKGWERGEFVTHILENGGTLVVDISGIWHVPEGHTHGVRILAFPRQDAGNGSVRDGSGV